MSVDNKQMVISKDELIKLVKGNHSVDFMICDNTNKYYCTLIRNKGYYLQKCDKTPSIKQFIDLRELCAFIGCNEADIEIKVYEEEDCDFIEKLRSQPLKDDKPPHAVLKQSLESLLASGHKDKNSLDEELRANTEKLMQSKEELKQRLEENKSKDELKEDKASSDKNKDVEKEDKEIPVEDKTDSDEDLEITKTITAVSAVEHVAKTRLSFKNISKFIENIVLLVLKTKDSYENLKKSEQKSDLEIEEKAETIPYTKEDFNKNVNGVNLGEVETALKCKGALLFTGAPGTGKTVAATNLARYLTGEVNSDRVTIVSFSETTSYGDVIEGLRPSDNSWLCESGSLKLMADRARADKDNVYIYIIDEINRGNTESILGEFMTAVERRGQAVKTNNNNDFIIPNNMYFIATMNSYDNSTKDLDMATYSRFAEYKMRVNYEINAETLGKQSLSEEVKNKISTINEYITKINNILVKDAIKKKENEIGARALYSNYSTVEELRIVIKYDILPDVIRRTKSLTEQDVRELKEIFKDIGKELTGEPIEWVE